MPIKRPRPMSAPQGTAGDSTTVTTTSAADSSKGKERTRPCTPENAASKLVFPWISPPRPLPGPYDPRLLPPLPNPTIRRYSQGDSPPPTATSSSVAAAPASASVDEPARATSIVYERRFSAASASASDAADTVKPTNVDGAPERVVTAHGTVTAVAPGPGKVGWRRNVRVVESG